MTPSRMAPLLLLLLVSLHLATATRQPAAVNNPTTTGGQDVCPDLREREKCTPKECVWCQNKYSPFPGSDGVCVDKSQASYLPMTYDCKRVKPAASSDISASVSAVKARKGSAADSTGSKAGIAAA